MSGTRECTGDSACEAPLHISGCYAMFRPWVIDREQFSLNELGSLSTGWRLENGWSIHPAMVCTKLFEECGEVACALTGELEGRAGRGDLTQETAQAILLLTSLLYLQHPEADLEAAIRKEMAS